MSYPYTKPQPRYGYRRSWNDPHVGLVGSGPGRPMRRYVTDPEVGLPQVGPGLGATMETPVTDGIFNVGPAAGFTRGVFTSDPPYATPRYIAASPDGVAGFGAFGETSCGRPELTKKLVDKFPSFTLSIGFPADVALKAVGAPTSFTFKPAAELVQPIVDTVLKAVGTSLAPYAKKGANALADFLASKLATPIANAIVAGAGVPDSAKKPAAAAINGLVNTTLRSKLVAAAKDMMACLGYEEPVAQTYPTCEFVSNDGAAWGWENGKSCKQPAYPTSNVCVANGLKAVAYPVGHKDNPFNVMGIPAYRCANVGTKMMQASIVPFPIQLDKIASKKTALETAMASATTIAAEQQKCFNSGGQWYPGGADCLVDANGNLYNYIPPTAATHKKYTCVPSGTPGATSSPVAVATGSSATGSSNLPLILGAAAIAALFLTRL